MKFRLPLTLELWNQLTMLAIFSFMNFELPWNEFFPNLSHFLVPCSPSCIMAMIYLDIRSGIQNTIISSAQNVRKAPDKKLNEDGLLSSEWSELSLETGNGSREPGVGHIYMFGSFVFYYYYHCIWAFGHSRAFESKAIEQRIIIIKWKIHWIAKLAIVQRLAWFIECSMVDDVFLK